uniref:EGF-like domain-containing protein n=1 Tax=Magallana gigas TaxID=29159 RepID=A0A8W8JHX5_MAGGI|nr:uncharacterized protein LOC117690770 [Crassostrea gigas]
MDVRCLVFLLVPVADYIYAQDRCEGYECCAGYMLDNNTSLCVPCNTGFIGKYCEKECPYPTFGDGCQQQCFCEQEHCSIVKGCVTLPGNGSSATLENEGISTSDIIHITVAGTEDKPSLLNPTKAALFEETSPPGTKSTAANPRQNNVGGDIKNGQNPMLVGIFVFNAFFVVIIFVIVMYCGIKKYRKHIRNKKDNSAISVQYYEIDEDLAGGSMSYRTLHTIEETEVRDKAYDDIEMGKFLVTYENEPRNGARQSSVIPIPPNRASQTMPKEFYPSHENLPIDNDRH